MFCAFDKKPLLLQLLEELGVSHLLDAYRGLGGERIS